MQGYPSSHRKAGNCRILPAGSHREMAVDVRHQAVLEIINEIVIGGIMLQGKPLVWGRARFIGAGIWQHDNHFLTVARGNGIANHCLHLVIVQSLLIAENSMQQVQHRVFLAGMIPGGKDYLGLAGGIGGSGNILDVLRLPIVHAVFPYHIISWDVIIRVLDILADWDPGRRRVRHSFWAYERLCHGFCQSFCACRRSGQSFCAC